ncbi:uncharacterized protein EKO05_0002345 [Ascochyta rabiei]|uniref:Uncharacterized protein n=1 Tax=Didymella rabiei TaxID=5454 RepID=A0A162VMD1_DIDRA|nr:uncharacterized protein EKO05_0002345 [Ascochyta rabiei]KZM18533.1 hypothetical protein ST47_g10317 [Ascochyta rabiei]UPX11755.1 hypothetical protein EKO05_0002345 [Ascochyta rabiei]
MAPSKLTTCEKPDTSSSPGKDSKVVKRPARGYHKFRSGILNVAPKGGEKALVTANQDAPLLRLPAEIRDRIWKYALGGKAFKARRSYFGASARFAPSDSESSNDVALLRSCRQIYSETAIYPSRLGMFACTNSRDLKRSAKKLKAYHRKQVMRLRLMCRNVRDGLLYFDFTSRYKIVLKEVFPALSHIEVLIHEVSDQKDDDFRKAADLVRAKLVEEVEDSGYAITVEGTAEKMKSYIESQTAVTLPVSLPL